LFDLFKATIRRLRLVGWRSMVSIIVAIAVGSAAVEPCRYHDALSCDGSTRCTRAFIIRLDWVPRSLQSNER
jgi:hypothetical protein